LIFTGLKSAIICTNVIQAGRNSPQRSQKEFFHKKILSTKSRNLLSNSYDEKLQLACDHDLASLGLPDGRRSSGCHAARMFVCRFSGFVFFVMNSFLRH